MCIEGGALALAEEEGAERTAKVDGEGAESFSELCETQQMRMNGGRGWLFLEAINSLVGR